MVGLPDLSKEMCTSIAVDPSEPYTVYIAISGPVKPGAGGPYKSTDGGRSFTWIGQGLPEGKPFFFNSPWSGGRQIAVDGSGNVVALGRMINATYRYANGSWTQCQGAGQGQTPNCIVADLQQPGRFYVGLRGGGGVWRTTDAGATWKRVLDKGANHLAADKAVAGRVACSTSDGIMLASTATCSPSPASAW
jgi:hypothetical protein